MVVPSNHAMLDGFVDEKGVDRLTVCLFRFDLSHEIRHLRVTLCCTLEAVFDSFGSSQPSAHNRHSVCSAIETPHGLLEEDPVFLGVVKIAAKFVYPAGLIEPVR